MGVVRGAVDGFEGLCLAGWAIAEPDDHSCVIEIRDEAGKVVAGGRATRSRPDLAVLGFGRTSFAFRIPLRELGAAASFTVTADGQPIQGSPVQAGRGIFDGFTDIGNGHLDGWVTERVADPAPPLIEIVDDVGTVLVSAMARIDRNSGDPHFMPARFFLPIPAALIGRGTVRLRTRANGVEVGPQLAVSLTLDGALDTLSATRCAGWLAAREDPRRRLEIEVFRDGRLVGKGATGTEAGERARAAPNPWNAGFAFALDEGPPSVALHAVSLRLAGTQIELFGGPFLAGNRAAVVAAARRAAHAVQAGGLDAGAGAVQQAALAEFIARTRHGPAYLRLAPARQVAAAGSPRLTVLVPVYRGVEVTRACIDSVLAQRDPGRDALLLVDDCSPEPEMAALLAGYAGLANVTVLTNVENQGFIGSVNRGLDACATGDVLLLNSDTRLFAGALDELVAVAHATPGVGTVTALSNNATVFTYPATNEPEEELTDSSWEELAAVALAEHRGQAVEVPTAHGFCMLVTRAMLDRVGRLNPVFGRGYGEENEFCQRGADLGFRHLAATGVLVEHRESISFGAEREALLKANLARLAAMYPEYDATIAAHERRDPLRAARWTLHRYRLAKASAAAGRVVLVVGNQLGGGTKRAEREIGAAVGYGGAVVLRLSCPQAGGMELEAAVPQFRLRFPPEEAGAAEALFAMLAECGVDLVLVHHTLGFTPDFIARLAAFVRPLRGVAYAHDFYPSCPRVTMIDALGRFCGGPEDGKCLRCVEMAGVHEASRTEDLTPAEHRALFADLLGGMAQVVAPSADTARHLSAVFPGASVVAMPHPHLGPEFPPAAREGGWNEIALLGAIGPHKGSAELLALARRARMTHPDLSFHVIGFTDIDAALEEVGNVHITGQYTDAELPGLVAACGARLALFLHVWPETFSYTLTEAAALGLVPVVPDLGAPAERVRAAGLGVVFAYPFDAGTVLDTLDGIAAGRIAVGDGVPGGYDSPGAAARIAELLAPAAAPPRRGKRRK